jgi:PAS domain S-box-containing protein
MPDSAFPPVEREPERSYAELVASEAKFRRLVEDASDMMSIWELDGTVTYNSPSFQRLFGNDPAPYIGRHFAGLVHPEDLAICQAANQRVVETGQSQSNVRFRHMHHDGSYRWISVNVSPIKNDAGEVVAMQGILRDVTESTRQAAILHDREEQLQAINSCVPGVIYRYKTNLATGEGCFDYMSSGAMRLYEHSPEALMQNETLAWAMVHPDDLAALIASVNQATEDQASWFSEFRLITPSGQLKWIQAQSEPAEAPPGFSFQNGVMIDITDRKLAEMALCEHTDRLQATLKELQRTQAQMVQAEKMSSLGQLVAGIAHEINNPVNFIHGNLAYTGDYTKELLRLIRLYQRAYPAPPDEIAEAIEAIDLDFLSSDLVKILASMQAGTARISSIVQSLRIFSRLDEAEVKSVDIHDGLESALLILDGRLQAQPHRAEIQVVKYYGELPSIECFAGQLNQVFMNILLNAIDVLEARDQSRSLAEQYETPSTIQIQTAFQSNQLYICIADNGPGIEIDVQRRLFDPFFTTKPVGKGTGLGMSISYQIITEKHHGKLSCHSILGQGAEFVIQIPIGPT